VTTGLKFFQAYSTAADKSIDFKCADQLAVLIRICVCIQNCFVTEEGVELIHTIGTKGEKTLPVR